MKRFKLIIVSLVFLFINPLIAVDKNPLKETFTTTLDVKEIFAASPIIYAILIFLSIAAVSIWMYCLFTFQEKNNH